MGNRVWRQSTVSGQTTTRKYIIDISGQLPTILLEIDTADSSLKKKYINADGQILCQHDVPDNNKKYFYLHDRLGSVRVVIDDTGAARNSYTYNPFGESFDSECIENVTNPFKFTGQFFDDEIEQYYLRARQYDPALMRFTTRDPERGSRQEPLTLHKYLYCQNNPIKNVDPTGRVAVEAELVAEAVLYAVVVDIMIEGLRQNNDRMFDAGLALGAEFANNFKANVAMLASVFKGGKQPDRDSDLWKYKDKFKGNPEGWRKFREKVEQQAERLGRRLDPEELDEEYEDYQTDNE